MIEMAILLRADSPQTGNKVLAEAAKEYNVNVDTIRAAVTQFAAKKKTRPCLPNRNC
jgi:hypothetical protein